MAKPKTPARKPSVIDMNTPLGCEIRQGLMVIREMGELACWSSEAAHGFIMAASDIASKLYDDIEKLEGRSDG